MHQLFVLFCCSQFIIVGVVKDAPVYSKLQDDQIRLLDVIETINDTPCHKLLLPDVDLQERFEHSIEERERIKLVLNRCISLPPVSRPLAVGRQNIFNSSLYTDGVNSPQFQQRN
jgi:hypothetical protein